MVVFIRNAELYTKAEYRLRLPGRRIRDKLKRLSGSGLGFRRSRYRRDFSLKTFDSSDDHDCGPSGPPKRAIFLRVTRLRVAFLLAAFVRSD